MSAPELSAERREALAEALAGHEPFGGFNFCACTPMDDMGCHEPLPVTWEQHQADALAPLIARLIAEAKGEGWDEGYRDGHDDEANARYDIGANPYRAEASGREGERPTCVYYQGCANEAKSCGYCPTHCLCGASGREGERG